jgi:hypothetical protein
MSDTNNAPRFFFITIGLALLGAVSMLCAYSFLVSGVVPSGELPSNHKWYLLANAPDDVIVVEGGSSAHLGIDVAEIARAYGRPAINVADQAGYHMLDKARRLDRELDNDASVIVNLEWIHAFREKPTNVYIDHVSRFNSDYLTGLPFTLRVMRSLNFGPATLFDIAMREPEEISSDYGRFKNIRGRSYDPVYRYGGYTYAAGQRELSPDTSGKTCDSFLLTTIDDHEKLSNSFRKALKVFGKMKRRGVEVVFVWPSVVDEDCYRDVRFEVMESMIRDGLAENGLEILGVPEDAKYSSNLIDNTYYHLTTVGRAIHTQKLIELLRGKIEQKEKSEVLAMQVEHYRSAILADDQRLTRAVMASAKTMQPGILYRPVDNADAITSSQARATGIRSSRPDFQLFDPKGSIDLKAPKLAVDRACLGFQLGSRLDKSASFNSPSGEALTQIYQNARSYVFAAPPVEGGISRVIYNSDGGTVRVQSVWWLTEMQCGDLMAGPEAPIKSRGSAEPSVCLSVAAAISGRIEEFVVKNSTEDEFELAEVDMTLKCTAGGLTMDEGTDEALSFDYRVLPTLSTSNAVQVAADVAGTTIKGNRFLGVYAIDSKAEHVCVVINHRTASNRNNSVFLRMGDGPWLAYDFPPLSEGQSVGSAVFRRPIELTKDRVNFLQVKSREAGLPISIGLTEVTEGACR